MCRLCELGLLFPRFMLIHQHCYKTLYSNRRSHMVLGTLRPFRYLLLLPPISLKSSKLFITVINSETHQVLDPHISYEGLLADCNDDLTMQRHLENAKEGLCQHYQKAMRKWQPHSPLSHRLLQLKYTVQKIRAHLSIDVQRVPQFQIKNSRT
jgi:hypothetical protein